MGVDHNQDVYPLPDGREAVFQWPERLSLAEFEDLEKWIALVMGKVKRWTELKEHLRAEDGGEGEP